MGLLVAVASLAACPGERVPSTTFNASRAYAQSAPAADRVLVMPRLGTTRVDSELYRGFTEQLIAGLTRCGVQTAIFDPDPLDLDPNARLARLVGDLKPVATLHVEATADHPWGTSGSYRQIDLAMKLVDLASAQVTWMADAAFRLRTDPKQEHASAGALATSIVAQLRTDGVLTRCPAGAP